MSNEILITKDATSICEHFNLGALAGTPARVHGGLLHSMWRITTNQGSYAIKELSADINLQDENVKNNYELSEYIADSFAKHGIQAVTAIRKDGKVLSIIDSVGYLAYPWVEGKVLAVDAISESKALKIAALLAKMHSINLTIPNIPDVQFDFHDSDTIVELIEQAMVANCSFANDLIRYKDKLVMLNEAFKNAIPTLQTNTVISHADLDQKNVLWDAEENPILIDWESAREVNATYDIMNTSFDWSGISINGFNHKLFYKMIDTYKKNGGSISKNQLEASFYGVIGNCLSWLIYNIKRNHFTDDADTKKLTIEQVNVTLNKILRLKNIPSLDIL